MQTQLKDTERLCSKLTEDVVKKEIKKYRENRIQVRRDEDDIILDFIAYLCLPTPHEHESPQLCAALLHWMMLTDSKMVFKRGVLI